MQDRIQIGLSNGISLSRLLLFFIIISGHLRNIPSLYHPYIKDANWYTMFETLNMPATVFYSAGGMLGSYVDQVFFLVLHAYWSFNFSFYALTGLSLWFSMSIRKKFDLKEYFFGRFFNIYSYFFIAIIVSFLVNILVFKSVPGDFDLNILILGAIRAKEVTYYNSPLWFMTIIFGLYLFFPFLVVISKKNSLIVFLILLPLFYSIQYYLGRYTFMAGAIYVFIAGITLFLVVSRICVFLEKYGKWLPDILFFSFFCFAVGIMYDLIFNIQETVNRVTFPEIKLGFFALLLTFSLGFMLPKFLSLHVFLRKYSAGVFPCFLYHIIPINLCTRFSSIQDGLVAGMQWLPHWITDSIFLVFLICYCIMLAASYTLHTLLFKHVIKPVRAIFANPIIIS